MRVFRWLGRFTMVAGPLLVLLVFVLAAFLMWVLVTATGTRWALVTAVEAMGGRITNVEGSVWNGLTVEDLSLEFPGVAMRLEGVNLEADWGQLLDRRAHVQALRVDTAWVDLTSEAEPAEAEDAGDSAPFTFPNLPVAIRVDEVAVGEVILTQDRRPLPMTLQNFSAALVLNQGDGQLWLRNFNVATDSIEARVEGEARLQELAHPWPLALDLDVVANGLRPASPVCFQHMLPTLPKASGAEEAVAQIFAGAEPASCPLRLNAKANGSLDAMSIALEGEGQGTTLQANAQVAPKAAMPLVDAEIALVLPDGSSLKGHAGWEEEQRAQAQGSEPGAAGGESLATDGLAVLVGELAAERLDVGQLAGGAIPSAVLGFDSSFRVALDADRNLRDVALDLTFHEGSRWNEEALSGSLAVATALPTASAQPASAPVTPAFMNVALRQLDIDVRLGDNHIHSQGGIGATDSVLQLQIQAPQLADFWPDVPGGVDLKGTVGGSVAAHTMDLQGRYTPENATRAELGTAPVALALKAQGGWGGVPEGWRGRIASLTIDHAHLGVTLGAPTEIAFVPAAVAPEWQWTVGATEVALSVHGRRMVALRHAGSRGGPGRWATQGSVEQFVISPQVLRQIGADFDIAALKDDERGGVKVQGARSADDWEMVLAMDWNLQFDGAPKGTISLRRLSGDLMVPGQMPFPLELQELALDLTLAPTTASSSRLQAELTLDSRRMGRVAATANTLVHATPGGGIVLNPSDVKTVNVDASMADLGWTSLIVGDALDIGGAVQANVRLQSRPDGSWASEGTIQGSDLRVVMIDQGVRLLDGTLQARLDGDRVVLERLAFPARLRAEPKEWRTAEWVNTNPDAKGGSLVVTGEWNIAESQGVIDAVLYRFPILQRADRYAMMTGNLRVDAALPNVDITGKLTADAGWFDLDMLGGIPTVDSDVVVVRAGEEEEVSVPLGMSLDLEVDLGPRFYLTGYGLNSGLVGNMRVLMRDGKLTGLGALRTRGGAIEAYGQRLQLRRGAITFQGDITRPVLDIEALRTGLAVEAGVRVAGTARSPRIELVSYPEVSEIEKLSWLLLGHGPNDTGGDMALLFSVGTSFLSDGEPFYRRFGIDEVSMRSGELTTVANVLPAESVVSGLDTGTSDIERRFISVSKRLTSGVTLSIRQALSQTGTVAQASYRLARGLTAEASVGTVNGLALVYRWFSRDGQPRSEE